MFGRARTRALKSKAARLGATVLDRLDVSPKGNGCELFRVITTQHGPRRDSEVHVTAETGAGKEMGYLGARPNLSHRTMDVFLAGVEKPSCGIGTRLYEAAAREACARELKLRSDKVESMTSFSRGFWDKQLKKKRAWFDTTEKRYVLKYCQVSLEGAKKARR